MQRSTLIGFAAGAVFGAALTGVAYQLAGSPETTSEVSDDSQVGLSSNASPDAPVVSDSSTPSLRGAPIDENDRGGQGLGAEAYSDSMDSPEIQSSYPAITSDSALRTDGATNTVDGSTPDDDVTREELPISDAHLALLKGPDGTNKRSIRADMEREGTDYEWAYFTEQAITQFIASHAKAGMFTIHSVICRSTICEIQVVGFDESTGSSWSEILYDMKSAPWYVFGQVGTSAAQYEGQWAMVTHMKRLPQDTP